MRVNIYKHEAPNGKCAYVTVMVLKDKKVNRVQSPVRNEFVEDDLEALREIMLQFKDEYDSCVIPTSKIFFDI